MKNLKTYKMFESSIELTPEQTEWLDLCTKGTWQLNPQTGEVDVDGDFHCDGQGLSDFKKIRFGEVVWNFNCDNNQLTTLEGAPQKVGGYFNCRHNHLTSLEGAPQKVGWNFNCDNNQLVSLEGAPQEVGGDFRCHDNPVSEKTLKSIFGIMETGKGYLEATEYLWPEIPVDDQALLYRPEFKWVGSDEARKLVSLKAYQGFKGML